MSLAKTLGEFTGREFHGPAAIPIAALAISAFGTAESISSQSKQNAAGQAAQKNQSEAIAGQEAIANQEASGPSFQSLLDAEKGGVNTFQSTAGGVPNIGAMVKSLFGENIGKALNASLQNRQAGLAGAAGTLGNVATEEGGLASAAAGAAGKGGNPYTQIGGALGTNLPKLFPGKPGNNTGVVTGPGTGGNSTDVPGPGSAQYAPNVPVTSGFDPNDPSTYQVA